MVNSEVPKNLGGFDLAHTIPETGIFSYVWWNFLMVNVCRDTNHMILWLKDNKKASCSSHDISATMTTIPCLFWTTDVKTQPKNRLDFLKIHTTGFSHLTEGRVLDVTSLRLASKGCVDPVSNAVCESVFLHRSPDGLMAFLVKRR